MKQGIFVTGLMLLLSSSALAQEPAPIIPTQQLVPPDKEAPPSAGSNNPPASLPAGIPAIKAPQPPLPPQSGHIEAHATTPDVADIRSMLFSPGDIQTIRSARGFYEQTVKGVEKGAFSEDDFLKKLEKVTTEKLDGIPQSFTYPQFFLASIAYHSHDDWVVWVNNEKITQDSGATLAGLVISHIEPGRVTFEWVPTRMDKIVDTQEYSEENPVKVDIAHKKIQFTLKPNQTFTSYAMRVVEGKVSPVTIDNSKGGVAAHK